jgi:hypothetical protein
MLLRPRRGPNQDRSLCACSSQDHLGTRMRDLGHPILAGAKNTNSWRTRKADLQRSFPLDILMVLSSAITVAADGERLTCGGFSLGQIIHLGSFEFITNYFSGVSLCPRTGNSGATFMGSTHSGTPSPWWAKIDYSVEEFLTASNAEGGFGLPSPRRHNTGAPPAPIATTP